MRYYLQDHSRFIIYLVFLWLSACATQIPVNEETKINNWQTHQNKLIELEEWKLKGRIAISMEKEAWSASLQWTQMEQDYLLRIIAPLGRGTFELQGDDKGVHLRLAQDRILHAEDPEVLLQDNFGWSVPVSGLVYWIKGVPDPDVRVHSLLLDDKGRITDMTQSGWQVSYSRYANRGEYELPGKIVMENGNLKIRIVIRDWII